MPQIKFNWVDIVFITLLVRICYIAFKNGVLPEFFKLLGLWTGFVLSCNNYALLSGFLARHTKLNATNLDVLSFSLIFFCGVLAFKLLNIGTGKLLKLGEGVSLPNKIVGLAFGLVRGFLLIGFLYTISVNSPFDYLSKSAKDKSFSGQYVSGISSFAYESGMSVYPWKRNDTPFVTLLGK
ncbi:MAG: CvpA family protein [Candidatus Omnitrophota bacterium]